MKHVNLKLKGSPSFTEAEHEKEAFSPVAFGRYELMFTFVLSVRSLIVLQSCSVVSSSASHDLQQTLNANPDLNPNSKQRYNTAKGLSKLSWVWGGGGGLWCL